MRHLLNRQCGLHQATDESCFLVTCALETALQCSSSTNIWVNTICTQARHCTPILSQPSYTANQAVLSPEPTKLALVSLQLTLLMSWPITMHLCLYHLHSLIQPYTTLPCLPCCIPTVLALTTLISLHQHVGAQPRRLTAMSCMLRQVTQGSCLHMRAYDGKIKALLVPTHQT